MARMTAEERRAAEELRREQAQAARRAQKVAAFKESVSKARAERIFTDDLWPAEGDRTERAIAELLDEYKRATRLLTTSAERMQARMAEALTRIADQEKSPWSSSSALSDLPADIESATTRRDTLAEAITRMAWATGWHVPQVTSRRDRQRRALRVSLDVVLFAREGEQLSGWVVRSTQDDAKFFLTVVEGVAGLSVERETAQVYETEEAAWLAAMALCGATL